MRASKIMTKKVHVARPDSAVRAIARLMAKARISAVPVVDDKKRVIGIVSEGDLLRRRETATTKRQPWWLELLGDERSQALDYVKSHGLTARDVMTRQVVSVTPSTDAADVAELLEKNQIKRVPVLAAGKLVGILSRGDLVRALARAKAKPRGRHSDASIREALRQSIRRLGWIDGAMVNYSVTKGVVELYGIVSSNTVRDGLRVLAENVAGVRRVKDDLQVRPALMNTAS